MIFVYGLCAISIILLFLSLLTNLGNMLNVADIIKENIKITFCNKIQGFCIYIAPVFYSISIVLNFKFTKEILSNLNVVITILMSLMFAIIGILYSVTKKKNQKVNQLVDETYTTTLFEIVICTIMMLCIFFGSCLIDSDMNFLATLVNGLICYMFFVIVLNLLIILKRINVLFKYRE